MKLVHEDEHGAYLGVNAEFLQEFVTPVHFFDCPVDDALRLLRHLPVALSERGSSGGRVDRVAGARTERCRSAANQRRRNGGPRDSGRGIKNAAR